MNFRVTLFDLLVLIGMIQGIITVFLLCLNKTRSSQKSVLIALLLTLVLLSSKILIHTLGFWNYPVFRYLPLAIDTTVQPLVYLYVCSLTLKSFTFKRKYILYFLPTLLFMAHALTVYVTVIFQPDLEIKNILAEKLFYNRVKVVEDGIAVVLGFIFWYLGLKQVQQYRTWLFNNQSSTKYQELTWLRNILVVTGILVIALLIKTLLENFISFDHYYIIHSQLFHIYLSIITYYIAFKGYRVYEATKNNQEAINTFFSGEESLQPAPAIYFKPEPGYSLKVTDAEKSPDEVSNSTSLNLEEIKNKILAALEQDQLYLHPELSLKELAQHINYPAALVSTTINQCFQKNFRNLINTYRVEEVKKRMLDAKSTHLSLLGMALDCGFNSEASFYRIFRQVTGSSPKDFINSRSN